MSPCILIPGGVVCIPRHKEYRYRGWRFQVEERGGPWPLRQDGEMRAHAGREFWRVYDCFVREENQEQYEVKP